jgi:hypothetical protein
MKIRNAYLEQLILCSHADSRFFFSAIFGFLLATLAVTSFGAPVEPSIWNHSCGHGVMTASNTDRLRVRHGVTKLIKVVKDQIAVAITHFKKEKKNINEYYKGVSFLLK